MANTVTILSYANTFADWMVTTNALAKENNDIAANNYTKPTGTLFLNDPTLGLQVGNNAIIAGQLQVTGIGSSATIQNNMTVGKQLYLTNTTLSLVASGQANVSGPILAMGTGTGLAVSNNATVGGTLAVIKATTLSNTLTVSSTTTIGGNTSISNTVYISGNTVISNNAVVTGNTDFGNYINVTNEVVAYGTYTSSSNSASRITRGNSAVWGTSYTNNLQANNNINTASLSVTSNTYTNFLQANSAVNTPAVSVSGTTYTNFLQANNTVNTAISSVTGTSYTNVSQANSAVNTAAISVIGTSYTNVAQANAAVNTVYVSATTNVQSNMVVANTSVLAPKVTVTSQVDANAASAFFGSLQTQGQLSVGGNFVINGTTIYSTNTFTLSAASASGQISYLNVNRGSSGANASIRWNEPNKYFDILDVNSGGTYSQIMTANMISNSTTSTNSANVASSLALYTANTNLKAYVDGSVLNNLQSQITANVTSLQSQITSNAAISSAGIAAAYARANTSSNTFNGTTGSATPTAGGITLTSTYGVTTAGSGNTITINTPQDLRTTANPTFNSLTLTTPLAPSQGGTGATSTSAALTALLPTGTQAGYVLTTGGPGNFYWAAGGGGGGSIQPGTTINSTRLSYTANTNGQLTFTTPTFLTSTQLRAYINGVRQFESEYSANISNSTISFSTAPQNGDQVLLEVDGYIINPYYANNIPFTSPFGNIVASANTIQLAIQDLETRKAALSGATFTDLVSGLTLDANTSNTTFATTGFVKSVLNQIANTWSTNISGNAGTVTNGVYTNTTYSNPSWLTSLDASKITSGVLSTPQGGTGLSSFTSGGAVYATSTSTLTSGTLPITAGGTGQTSAAGALTALLPAGTTAGYVLTTGGPGTFYWAAGGGGGGGATPGTTINSSRLFYTATASQTAFTTPTYTPGASQLRVYINGIRQFNSAYAETNGTTVTLNEGCASGDSVMIEVDGYINNPYYANNITFTAPQGSIPGTANTIQLAIQDLESRKAALAGATFTGDVRGITMADGTANTSFATTAYVTTYASNATNIITGTLASARLGTTGTPQLGSLGVGTAASGTTGEIRATNNITAYYSSDRKFKENIEDIPNALDTVDAIGGKLFDWTEEYMAAHGGEDGYFVRKADFGVIAQDVQQVFPRAVREKEDGTLAVDYEKLCALAFQAIKELKAEVDALKGNNK